MKNMSNTVIKECKHHGETEFYAYDYTSPRCKECVREKRRARYDDPVKAKIDRDYSRKWSKDNREYLNNMARQKNLDKVEEIEDEKQWMFVEHVEDLRKIFKIYRPTKEYTDLELVNMGIKFSKTLIHSFNWDKFKDRMKNKIRQNIYMNEFSKIKSREGWIKNKTVNQLYQNNYPNAPESDKIRMRKEALLITEKKLKNVVL